MDTQNAPTELTAESATSAFAEIIEREESPQTEAPAQEARAPEPATPEPAAEPAPVEMVTVKIDGREVQVPLDELKNGYQRQADYTRKTMELSEQRKAAEAQAAQANQERAAYTQNLARMQAQLEGALQEQAKIDWEGLLQSDPVEYLRQQHLANQRQAQLQQNYAEQQRIASQLQAEQARQHESHLSQQQEALLAKLPDWKDAAKAKAEKQAIAKFLMEEVGYQPHEVSSIADARAVQIAREAMLYRQMMAKANVAQKQVSTLPSRVERPGSGSEGLDRRASAFQRLSKSGRAEDAAAVIAGLI